MKTVQIEQINATKMFTYGGLRAEYQAAAWRPWLKPLQPKPHKEILRRNAFTETENYNCVSPEMNAMMNDHAIIITTTN